MGLIFQIDLAFIFKDFPLKPVFGQCVELIFFFQSLSGDYPEVVYLPRFLEGIAADRSEYMQDDGIHPTALAQPLLAKRVFDIFWLNFGH